MNGSPPKLRAERDGVAVDRRSLLRAAAGIATSGVISNATSARATIWEEGEEQCHASPREKDPKDIDDVLKQIDDALLADFMKVSRTLTGMPLSSLLDLRLGREYLERFVRLNLPAIKLIQGNQHSAETLMNDSELRPAAEQLIYLWYLSAFFLPTTQSQTPAWIYGTTEQYERALLWTVIGAHAPLMPMRGSEPNHWAKPGRLPHSDLPSKAI